MDLPKSRLVSRALELLKDGADRRLIRSFLKVRSFLKGGVDLRLNGGSAATAALSLGLTLLASP